MTTDPWTALLSDYLDHELPPDRQEEVARHLATCPQCRATLEELNRLRDWASAYRPECPDAVGWRRLERHIHRRRTSLRALRAAVVALAVIGAALLFHRISAPPEGAGTAPGVPAASLPTSLTGSGRGDYAAEVGALEALLRAREDELDPRSRQVIVESLRSMEESLARIRRELAEHPESELLQELQRRSRDQRLGLLRRVLKHLPQA